MHSLAVRLKRFRNAFVGSTAFVAVLLLALVAGSAARADGHRPIMRLSTGNLPPVSTPARDGYLNRLVIELFGRADYSVEFIDLPPRRAIANANNGLHDGDAARDIVLSETAKNLRPMSSPIFPVDFVGLYLDPDIRVEKPEDYTGYSVGYIRGWHIAEKLFEDHPNAIAVSTPGNLLRLLKEDRIDVAFLTRAPGQFIADQNDIEDLKFTSYSVRQDFFVYLNIRHILLLPKLDSLLEEMRADGTYDEIMAGYLTQ